VERGEQVRSFVGHESTVFRVAWSLDGKVLLSGGITGTIRWWDVASGAGLQTQQGHQGWIRSLRVSGDGAMLASSGEDGVIRLWDMQRAEIIRTLRLDRPYERMDITGLTGITAAQRASLITLGAVERQGDQHPVIGDTPQSIADASYPQDAGQPTQGDQSVALCLPFQPTSFIGRDAELTQIARLLANPSCRLLTLIGPGGIGKTRLALEVVSAQTAAFADGVAFVALASVDTPRQIVSTIGDSLGLAFAEHPGPTAHLLGYLRERHMLLVLDNFEHLLDGADLVADMLAHAPKVTVIVTSRERLKLQAEWLFDVGGLAYPLEDPHGSAPSQSQAQLADYSAVQLFVQRATQVQPALALDATTLLTIVHICQHVAGMPLAIELAAAGARTLPLAEIERQIGANLDALVTTMRDVPPRHRSVRAVFDHSWKLLDAHERVLLSRLAVFRGGWTAAAAEAVCTQAQRQKAKGKNEDSDEPLLSFTFSLLPLLTALVEKSLVRQSSAAKQGFATDAAPNAPEPRFTLLEPIREYALEQLVARGEAQALQHAHAVDYQTLAEAVAAQWGTATFDRAIPQLQREYDNMRAAMAWACDSGDSLLGLRLAEALWQFWRSYGYISEGRAWLEQLLALEATPADPSALAARQHGLHAAGWLASDQHDYAQAAQFFEESMALGQVGGEVAGETDVLLNAARQARAAGDYQRATALLERAMAWHRAQGHGISIGRVTLTPALHAFGQLLRELGLVTREQGDFGRASALFEESLAFHGAVDDRACVALALIGLADVACDQGDTEQVQTYGEEALAILRESGMQWAIGFTLNTLALGAYYAGDLAQALTLIRESEALFRDLDAGGSLAEILITVGKIERALGDMAAAYAALSEVLWLAQATGPRLFVAASLEGLASVAAVQGHANQAVRLLAAASALRKQMGTPVRPVDQAAVEQTLVTARSTLGVAFATVWAEAQTLPLERILSTIPSMAAFNVGGDR